MQPSLASTKEAVLAPVAIPTETKADWTSAWRERLMRKSIPGLDGARALAVLLVVAGHFGFPINSSLGVLIFFVLSGFLITWLMLKEVDTSGTVNLKNFYMRRMLRIFPAFYAFWLIALTIYIVRGHDFHPGQAISAFFYFSNYYMALVPTGDAPFGHTWSLSIEEQFYLLWPLLFLTGIGNPRRLAKIMTGAIVGVWIYRGLAYTLFDVRSEYLYRAFDTRFDHLAIGCLMALLLKQGVLDDTMQALIRRAWFPAVILALIFAMQPLHESLTFTYVVGYAIEPLLIAAFILQLIWFADKGVWRIFEHPIVRYLGHISYPMYLWQQLTLFTAKRISEGLLPLWLQFAFALTVTIAFASASYFLIERPFLRLKSRL
jgi:peptidoglycan/LPS O-acetylase OafA/YrhL